MGIADSLCFCDMSFYYTNETAVPGNCVANNTYCPDSINKDGCQACY